MSFVSVGDLFARKWGKQANETTRLISKGIFNLIPNHNQLSVMITQLDSIFTSKDKLKV